MDKKNEEETVEKEFTAIEAKEVLRKEQEQRVQNCTNEINQVLGRYNCMMDISITINGNGTIVPNIRITPR